MIGCICLYKVHMCMLGEGKGMSGFDLGKLGGMHFSCGVCCVGVALHCIYVHAIQ